MSNIATKPMCAIDRSSPCPSHRTSLAPWPAEEDSSLMLRVLGAFLCVFWLLSLVVHLGTLAYLFGVAALTLFGIDLLCQILQAAHATAGREEAPFVRRGNHKA